MAIKQLNQETINLISAGEVIERPADILKELLENSIDANSKNIEITIKNSGIDYLEIKDDGDGISKKDLEISKKRHTTSKIQDANQLFSLNSYGFRGEALASIDAVSKLSIKTSTDNSSKGYLLDSENKLEEVKTTKGTKIIVKDLFYNQSARKKFLKSKSFEFTKLYDIFIANAILYPNISFRFNSEKKNIILNQTTQENRYVQIFGKQILEKTIPIEKDNGLFKIKGILSKPGIEFYFPTNFLFINRRFVFSSQIQKTISSAYRDYLMIQQKPFFILFFEINSQTVDVNVHPKKRYVKLQNEMIFLTELKSEITNLFEGLKKTNEDIKDTQRISNFSKDFSFKPNSNFSKNQFSQKNFINHTNTFNSPNLQQNLFSKNQTQNISENKPLYFDNNLIKNVLGQINGTYIVCELEDGFLLIDQHAADERINLEKNRKENNFEKQNLLIPKEIDNLSLEHLEVLKNNKSKIKDFGFDYEIKDNKVNLKSMPRLWNRYFESNMFINLLEDISKNTKSFDNLKDNLLKLKSCKSSIKANEPLSFDKQIDLIKRLDSCKDKTICAHGRPTVLYFSLNDIEKLFKRIV